MIIDQRQFSIDFYTPLRNHPKKKTNCYLRLTIDYNIITVRSYNIIVYTHFVLIFY